MRDGARLTREEGMALLRDGDFLELGALADTVRWRKHPEPVVTYIIDRNINYTNVCTAQCAFCAFYRDLPSKEGYLLSKAELSQKIEETIALGGEQILLQGGLHPDLGIEFYEELFRWMKGTLPASGSTASPRRRSSTSPGSRSCPSRSPAPADGGRARLDPGRRGGDPVRPRAEDHRHRARDRPPSGSRSWRRRTGSGCAPRPR